MGGQTISTSETKIEALRLQSSAYGVTMPYVAGVTRIAGNMAWYNGFKSIPKTESQGGKGGVTQESTTYTYAADVIMGLCHGPISGVTRVWKGKEVFSGGVTPGQLLTATETYTGAASGTMAYTLLQSATYSTMVSITAVGYGLETWSQTLSQGADYNVSNAGVVTIVNDQWRNTQLTITYRYTTGTVTNTALSELGLSLKTGKLGQSAFAMLSSYGTENIGYSGLALVGGQAYGLGSTAQVENHNFEIVGPLAYHLGTSIPDVDPSLFLRTFLTNSLAGAAFPSGQLDNWATWSDYCVAAGILISPALTEQVSAAGIIDLAAALTNTAPVWSSGRLKMVPLCDEVVTGNGRTFTPNTVPVYELDDTAYTPSGDGESPIRVNLKTSADRHNHIRVQYRDRANQYNDNIAEAKDQSDARVNGLRTKPVVAAKWICTAAAAQRVAQHLLQRSLYVTADYTFPLPWHFALLEPGDLVTLTDAELEMSQFPVRITEIQETEDGDLMLTCEDYPPGVASAPQYPAPVSSGYQHDYNAAPGSVNAPFMFEAPAELTTTGLEVYAAVRGDGAAWGGCQVWVSLDGSNYRQVGELNGGSRYGALSAAAAASASSFAVDGLKSTDQLLNGSTADAIALNTLCYIAGTNPEFFSYTTATLSGTGAYVLSGLVHSAYGTDDLAHANNDKFVRVDSRVAKSGPIDLIYIGKTIRFKFPSFNVYGGAQQSLADATEYTYTITGAQASRLRAAYRAVAQGSYDTEAPAANGLYDGNTGAVLDSTWAVSYRVTVIRRSDGKIISATTYDIFTGGTAPATMAAALNALAPDVVVVVRGVREPANNRLTGGLETAMYRCGASRGVFGSPEFKTRSAYVLVAIGGCGEGNGFEAYQGATDDSTNAWCDVAFRIDNGNLFVTGTAATPRTLRDYSYTGDLDATNDLRLIGRGVTVNGNNGVKTGGTDNTWDADMYSVDGYVGGAFVSFVASSATLRLMVGLNTDPAANTSFNSIDYAIYQNVGTIVIYESGTSVGTFGAYAVGDSLCVLYDGTSVRYTRNGTLLRTVTASPGKKYFADSSLYDSGVKVTGLRFGPLTPKNRIFRQATDPALVAGVVVDGDIWQETDTGLEYKRYNGAWYVTVGDGSIDTDQIADKAATEILTDSASGNTIGATGVMTGTSPQITFVRAGKCEISITATLNATVVSVNERITLDFSFSGSGAFEGDANPTFPVLTSIGTGKYSFTHTVTLTKTGAGPWSMQAAVSGPGSANRYTVTSLAIRATEIKK
jgi:hypothetical protein